ncbi:MAG: MBL fold metallo-hydrolase [Acidobacteria bacterium]|nr:MBL fold metallo-hydrolase [Acidobacteriota bacterium]MCL5286423.1 MBL fold metallo-hydrolase [Acidobacteriota bacterium]
MATLTFLGAAGSVTGSKHLVEAGGKRLLMDCGLFQGNKELRLRNWDPLPVDPETIDWIILSHAHIDHTGYLPRLLRDGFRGTIFCNSATRDLCSILLPDSARIQEEDAEHAAFKGFSKHESPQPLYTVDEAQATLGRMQVIPDSAPVRISSHFSVRLLGAGHILGSSMVELTITENGVATVVLFSGDLGRYDQPILRDPEPPPRCDVLVCESTYGDREHPTDSPLDALGDIITRVAKRGGAIVMPAFAVGRTQLLMYYLRQLEDWDRIPTLPVYVDSPMAVRVTDLYVRHKEDHDLEFSREAANGNHDPLNCHEFHLTRSAEESKQINRMNMPCIIISASGMATGGRVLHHLARRLPDSRNAVLLAGFQAEGTRGRSLAEGAKTLRIHGEDVPVKAEIIPLHQFSGHAGRSELLHWMSGLPEPPRRTFLVHGEPQAANALQAAVREQFQWPVDVAAYQQEVKLTPPE